MISNIGKLSRSLDFEFICLARDIAYFPGHAYYIYVRTGVLGGYIKIII